jgi:metal-sulfur cluster biosynthetic enzyme
MTAAATAAARAEEVRGRLARVDDPELDEPVTELGFITAVDVDPRGAVMIGFRLPTYWCAANFAFIMADDMRREVLALPWVRRVDVVLGDHMYADKINHGIAHGLSFQHTFGRDASGDIADIRRSFHLKAFQRRQEALLRHLLDTEHDPAALVAASLSELRTLPLNVEGNRLRARYLDRRQIPAPAGPDAPAFVNTEGRRLVAGEIPSYLRLLARVGVNAEFNGALCKGLLAARFGQASPDGQPGLVDFIRQTPAAI